MHTIKLQVRGGSLGSYDVARATLSYPTTKGPVERTLHLPWSEIVWLPSGALVQLSAHVPAPRGPLMASIYQMDTGHYVTRTMPGGTEVSVSTVVQSK